MGREQDAWSGHSLPLPSKLLARLHEVSSVFSSESHTKAVSLALRERKSNGAPPRTRVPSHQHLALHSQLWISAIPAPGGPQPENCVSPGPPDDPRQAVSCSRVQGRESDLP